MDNLWGIAPGFANSSSELRKSYDCFSTFTVDVRFPLEFGFKCDCKIIDLTSAENFVIGERLVDTTHHWLNASIRVNLCALCSRASEVGVCRGSDTQLFMWRGY